MFKIFAWILTFILCLSAHPVESDNVFLKWLQKSESRYLTCFDGQRNKITFSHFTSYSLQGNVIIRFYISGHGLNPIIYLKLNENDNTFCSEDRRFCESVGAQEMRDSNVMMFSSRCGTGIKTLAHYGGVKVVSYEACNLLAHFKHWFFPICFPHQ